ncbi:Vmc-like lipoprotein signal peptide domain-containing protein [Mycoplasmopsis cynos]|uniref:Vmc-like lipoprotein signal peptide domain-containing protein n=1 Tax=Mycoplasmopsis cynos TaxID=171284 RepID=UPI0030CCF7CB
MSKYKKIFSGLGLLSISTLIGASVVACANKKPKASDSSAEAIEQNNNQGNSTTPEQGKPEMPQNPAPGTDHNNQEKPETPKEDTPAPDAPSTPTPEMPKDTPEQNGNTGQSNDSKGNTQDQNKGEAGKDDSKQENEPAPTPQLPEPKVTVDGKVKMLYSLADQIPYPDQNTTTKQDLKAKVDEIKNKQLNDVEKINQLTKLEATFNEYKMKVEKYKEIINNAKFKSNKYGDQQINGLNGRLNKLFSNDLEDKYTESELIWNIYETFRRKAFVKSNNFTPKIYEYSIVENSEKDKHSTMFEALADDKKKNHGINIAQLEQKINNIVNFTIEIAKKAANKNIDKIKYTNSTSDAEKPNMLIEKLKGFVSATTNLADIDTLIDTTNY